MQELEKQKISLGIVIGLWISSFSLLLAEGFTDGTLTIFFSAIISLVILCFCVLAKNSDNKSKESFAEKKINRHGSRLTKFERRTRIVNSGHLKLVKAHESND